MRLDDLYGDAEYPDSKAEAERDFNAFVDELGWLKASDKDDYFRAVEALWREREAG